MNRRWLNCAFSLAVVASTALSFGVQPGRADDLLWKTLFDAGAEASEQCRLPEAEKQLKAALTHAESFGENDARLFQTLCLLAAVYEEDGKFPLAVETYERSVKAAEKTFGAESKQVVSELSSLARCAKRLGNHEKSTSTYLKAIGILERKYPQTPSLAANYHNLAVVFQEQGKFTEAEGLYKKAINQYEKVLGPEAKHTLLMLQSLARCYCEQWRYTEAEPLMRRGANASHAFDKADTPEARSWLLALADVLVNVGKNDEAKELYTKAVESARAQGAKAEDYSDVLEEAGKYYSRQGKYMKSLECLKDALAEREKGSSLNNPKLCPTLIALAEVYAETADYSEAENLLKRAVKSTSGGCSSATALMSMGKIYTLQGKYSEAKAAYHRALELVEADAGTDHPDVAATLTSLGWVFTNERQWKDAIPVLEKALALREKAFGPRHPLVAQSLSNLADAAAGSGDLARAETLTKRAIEICDETVGTAHENTLVALRQLALLKRKNRNLEGAEDVYRDIIQREEKAEPKDNVAMATDLTVLAELLTSENKLAEAGKMKARAQELKSSGGITVAAKPHAVTIRTTDGQTSPVVASRTMNEPAQTSGEAMTRPVKDKWAVVVGISNFKDPTLNLKYAAKDAVDFRNYLVNEANFKPDHVKLLLDGEATRDNIVATLGERWLRRLANSDDLVVVYMSSHGSAPKQEASNHNFIVPYEGNLENIMFTGIPMQWLTAGLKELVHCDRVAILLDVCHGGAVKKQESRGLSRETAFSMQTVTPGTGQIVLASSDSDQLSWESRRYANGVFTRKLMDALRSNGHETNLRQAYDVLKASVEEEVLRDRAALQTPILVMSSWSGRDLVLGAKPISPRPGLEAGTADSTARSQPQRTVSSKSMDKKPAASTARKK